MSIFDVIRYGNINISSADQLRLLPKQIFWTYYYKVSSDEKIYPDEELAYSLKLIDMSYRYLHYGVTPAYQLKLRRLFEQTLLEYNKE